MFETPKYIQQSYSIVFAPIRDIRKRANEFEDLLGETYSIPQIIPVPDDFDPNAPRIIFTSKHGYSNILISQISITFQVNYAPNYQLNEEDRISYIRERIEVLHRLLGIIHANVAFSGFTTTIHIPWNASEVEMMKHLLSIVHYPLTIDRLYEAQFTFSEVYDDHFFINTVLGNYRIWREEPIGVLPRLSTKDSVEQGTLIQVDVNDRYAFNEAKEVAERSTFDTIFGYNLDRAKELIQRVTSIVGGIHD